MKALINGKIVFKDGIKSGLAVLFDEKIVDIIDNEKAKAMTGIEFVDADGKYVLPGLVDIHIHGYNGVEAGEDTENSVPVMAEGVIKNGVTSFLPTTMTVAKEDIEKSLTAIRGLKEKSKSWDGAEVIGANVEGPFINPSKKGAQDDKYILKPDASFVKKYADVIKIITLAPEMDEDMACITEVKKDTDVLISMGHTGADYDTAVEAVRRGVGHVTHLFNAMTPLMHRNPGVVGAALGEDVTVEIIADTFHINPGLYSIVYKVKGEKMLLITDCIRAGGLSDGEYTLGGQKVVVNGIQCKLEDGTIAGSVLKLNNAIRNIKEYTDIPLHEIVNAASFYPAQAIGISDRKGSVAIGKDADLVIADEDISVLKVFKSGKAVV
ncbi:MAG: N-acetylglucosamine-6-phosphate deacetylase [Ruminococcaceae bacterium]|nr:N-acetylglucosamine-6-phosphate deacetylase [Oscillospiraceae bacterium]